MQENNNVIIGYWSRNNNALDTYEGTLLPWPLENSAGENQSVIIERLSKAFEENELVSYRGWSTCRLCGKHNGSKELELIRGNVRYRIPEGYIHYLRDHNVSYDPILETIL